MSATTVSVCIATYKRPTQLVALLTALGRQTSDVPDGVEVDVVVVDNDPEGSAAGPLESGSFELPVRYVHEPLPGISAARNAGVAAAWASEFLVFVDDDETPRPGWLAGLLSVQRVTGASIVSGPVVPVFSTTVPEWVAGTGFFEQPTQPTGTVLGWTGTGNVLVKREVLGKPDPFDLRFGLRGGSDTHLFMRLALAGSRPVWAAEAAVEELVSDQRMTRRWATKRAFRSGNCTALAERDIHGVGRVLLVRFVKGLGHVIIGSFRPLLPFRGKVVVGPTGRAGKARFTGALFEVAHGAGMVAGVFNLAYVEYKRKGGQKSPHGGLGR